MRVSRVNFSFVYYNARLDVLSIPVLKGLYLYVETEYEGCLRPMVPGHWEQIGFMKLNSAGDT